jgi:hypothetical protein
VGFNKNKDPCEVVSLVGFNKNKDPCEVVSLVGFTRIRTHVRWSHWWALQE